MNTRETSILFSVSFTDALRAIYTVEKSLLTKCPLEGWKNGVRKKKDCLRLKEKALLDLLSLYNNYNLASRRRLDRWGQTTSRVRLQHVTHAK
jgi:hypothetical protein